MEDVEFQCWLAQYSNLNDIQKSRVADISKYNGSLDIHETLESMKPSRLCPHCESTNCIKRGKVDEIGRASCRERV